MNHPIVPNDFHVPERFATKRFLLRMLTMQDVDKDYEAVMSSLKYLQRTRPFGPNYAWPQDSLTHEQDLIDLGWHQKEFQMRSSFAYTVMSLDESVCLGCMYIFPSPNVIYDAQIMMWVRQSETESGLDTVLFDVVRQWIHDFWPFQKPGYPGREIDWPKWNALT